MFLILSILTAWVNISVIFIKVVHNFNFEKRSSSECVGSFGFNCSVPCPQDYFGPSCASMCQCGKDECDAKLGCPKGTVGLLIDVVVHFF